MNKYRIKKTDILHNGKVYAEGSEIELEDDVAGMLDNYLELIEVLKKAAPAPKSTSKPKQTLENQESKPVEKQEVKVADIIQNNKNKQNTIQDQQNNTKDPENNGENNTNNTSNFVPPNMRKE